MLSFLARSALCIGAVAAVASGAGPERLFAAIGREAREAADGAGRACLASRGCLQTGAEALAATTGAAPGAGATRGPVAAAASTAPPFAGRPVRKGAPGGG